MAEPAPPASTKVVSLTSHSDEARRYREALVQHIDRHKRYPASLKKAKVEGQVVLQFTIDRHGRLMASNIKQSSGNPELDSAALSMLARANPMPPIPASLNQDEMELTRAIEYSLITNR